MKGGISETRIEKRIVITGDTEIDHDKVGDRFLLLSTGPVLAGCVCVLLETTSVE